MIAVVLGCVGIEGLLAWSDTVVIRGWKPLTDLASLLEQQNIVVRLRVVFPPTC